MTHYSSERILVTHAGSLPRPSDLREMVVARTTRQPYDAAALAARLLSWRRPAAAAAG
jgi:hypothetical protein